MTKTKVNSISGPMCADEKTYGKCGEDGGGGDKDGNGSLGEIEAANKDEEMRKSLVDTNRMSNWKC